MTSQERQLWPRKNTESILYRETQIFNIEFFL